MKVSGIKDERVNESKQLKGNLVDGVCEFTTLRQFVELLTRFHIAPGVFRDNIKQQDHLIQIEFLCFDFDDGKISSLSVHDQLKETVNHVIVGSKNWCRDKGDGKGEIERFHLFIPMEKPITNVEFYKFVCQRFAKLHLWNVDRNCLEPSRYFYKHPIVLWEYDKRRSLELDRFEKLKQSEEETQKKKQKDFFNEPDDRPATEKFQKTKYYKMMEAGELKTDGKRYDLSCRIIGGMIACGLSDYECIDLFDRYATFGKSFTRESIVRRIQQWKH